ncbi:hypothetical protein J4212_05100 [Candidatus Woesearchaeota archaeon]|nr:hypothetical protein [Candidatus Woesearchaeota archaeon]
MMEGPKDEKTHVRCRTIIEVLGKPKEHVEETIRKYTGQITKDENLVLLNMKISEPQQHDDLWSAFAELELVIKGIGNVIGFCFDYMPSSIEILKPEEFVMKAQTIQDFVNDLQARLHSVDMAVKKQKNENDFLRRNLSKAVSNIVLVALSKNKLDMEHLSKITGIHSEELDIFLKDMIKGNKIKEEGGLYSIA